MEKTEVLSGKLDIVRRKNGIIDIFEEIREVFEGIKLHMMAGNLASQICLPMPLGL